MIRAGWCQYDVRGLVCFFAFSARSVTQFANRSEVVLQLNTPFHLGSLSGCRPLITQKRLSRMLGKHEEVAWIAENLLLGMMRPKITDEMVIGIDPGDLNRAGSHASEGLCQVRDGDQGEIVNGYPLMGVVARSLKTGETLPLLMRLLSSLHYCPGQNSPTSNSAYIHRAKR